jgi:hypothetical protein
VSSNALIWPSLYQLLSPFATAGVGLIGVLFGGWIANRNAIATRRFDFLSRQLAEFYGPLLSIRNELRARGELRAKLDELASQEWGHVSARLDGMDPSAAADELKNRYEPFGKMIEFNNERLRDTSMPAYREMLRIFRERAWLADVDTRAYFNSLVEFVEVWERFLDKAMPREVLTAVKHSEQNLMPLYEHIERRVNALQLQLSSGN